MRSFVRALVRAVEYAYCTRLCTAEWRGEFFGELTCTYIFVMVQACCVVAPHFHPIDGDTASSQNKCL